MWGHWRRLGSLLGLPFLLPSLVFSAVQFSGSDEPTGDGSLPDFNFRDDASVSWELHRCFTQQMGSEDYVYLYTPLVTDDRPSESGHSFQYAGDSNSAGDVKVILASPHVMTSSIYFWAQLFGPEGNSGTRTAGVIFSCKGSTRQYILFDFGSVTAGIYSFQLSIDANGANYVYTVLGIPFKMDTITGNGLEYLQGPQSQAQNESRSSAVSVICSLTQRGHFNDSYWMSLLALLALIPALRFQQRKKL